MKKLIADALENDRKEREQQMKALQDQVQELIVSQNHRLEEENNSGGTDGSFVRGDKEKSGTRVTDIKVDIPEYDGKMDPDEFLDWMRTVERVFDYKQLTEAHKVKIVALKFRKYASTWWSNVCLQRERSGKDKIQTWFKMKKKLKEKFLPSYYIQQSFGQLHSLKQGTSTVEEYSREFEYLLMKCDVPEDDPQTLVRYLGGLESRVAQVVELHPYQTLADLTLLAHKVDVQQRGKGKYESSRFSLKPNLTSKSNSNFKPTPPITHKTPSVPNTNSEPQRAPRRCFRCQGLGHIASECPNKRVISLADFESAGGFEAESNETIIPGHLIEDEVEVTGPDDGPCLVVR